MRKSVGSASQPEAVSRGSGSNSGGIESSDNNHRQQRALSGSPALDLVADDSTFVRSELGTLHAPSSLSLSSKVATQKQDAYSSSTQPDRMQTSHRKSKAGILSGRISTLFRRDSNRSSSLSPLGGTRSRDQAAHHTRSSKYLWSADADDEQSRDHKRKSRRPAYSSHDTFDDNDNHHGSGSQQRHLKSHSMGSRYSNPSNLTTDDEDNQYGNSTMTSTSLDNHDDDTLDSPTSMASDYNYDDEYDKTILRYRGFSTSIQSLFLDESLVCAACGCFGLFLSHRTEYLLQLRLQRRNLPSSSNQATTLATLPSRIVAHGLLATIMLMISTFCVFGFGGTTSRSSDAASTASSSSSSYSELAEDESPYYESAYVYEENLQDGESSAVDDEVDQNEAAEAELDIDDDGEDENGDNHAVAADDDVRRLAEPRKQPQQVRHDSHGIFKLRDAQESLLNPVLDFVRDEWYRDGPRPETSYQVWHRRQQQQQQNPFDEAQQQRDLGSNIRIALLFTFLLFLGVLGRRRRMRTRFYLVKSRAQEDQLYYASTMLGSPERRRRHKVNFEDTRENQYEGACSHTLCGCYPVDPITAADQAKIEQVEVLDSGITQRKPRRFHEDIVARGFNCFMALCCGAICKCWFQCLSVCALAQEAREMRLLIPPRYQRIDFITHQPFHEYQKDVNNLRLGWMGRSELMRGIMPHWHALSRLSRYILVCFTLAVATIVGTLLLNPRAVFAWQDAVILAATFLQSFLVLFIVHWIFHKSDLSLDAVIKLFAAGFVIAVPSAIFFEGLLVNTVLFWAWGLYELFVVTLGDSFIGWVFDHWRLIWIIGELFNAYVVAAITEELCKYYTFRAVEHPDLMFLTGLQLDEHPETVADGGIVNYPFSSHYVQEVNKEMSDDASNATYRSHKKRNIMKRKSSSSHRGKGLLDDDKDLFEDEEPDMRTHRQRAMAITTGMISVAVGLACAENFLYVFVLGGAFNTASEDQHKVDITEEWIVLFFRSIFPIHALAAAMQSINMIRKFVETTEDDGHRIGVGRIVLPAVLLHGTFDAVLLGINVYIETAWDKYKQENGGVIGEDPPYNTLIVNIVAWLSITVIMIAGLIWYFFENRKQSKRLAELEHLEKQRIKENRKPTNAPSLHVQALDHEIV